MTLLIVFLHSLKLNRVYICARGTLLNSCSATQFLSVPNIKQLIPPSASLTTPDQIMHVLRTPRTPSQPSPATRACHLPACSHAELVTYATTLLPGVHPAFQKAALYFVGHEHGKDINKEDRVSQAMVQGSLTSFIWALEKSCLPLPFLTELQSFLGCSELFLTHFPV